jgi:hypothetical protein
VARAALVGLVAAAAGGAGLAGAACSAFDEAPTSSGSGAATVAVVKDAGLNGSGAFVVSLTDDQTVQSGYLQLDSVPNGPEAYTMILSFSANVTTTGTGFLLGPRFDTDEGKLGEHDLIIGFHAGQTRLDHYAPSATAAAPPRTRTPHSRRAGIASS